MPRITIGGGLRLTESPPARTLIDSVPNSVPAKNHLGPIKKEKKIRTSAYVRFYILNDNTAHLESKKSLYTLYLGI